MATLSEVDRNKILAGLMRHFSSKFEEMGLDVSELKQAIDSTDVWIDNNQASFNSSLPASAQSALTPVQKTLLFCTVALGRLDFELLKKIVGEL